MTGKVKIGKTFPGICRYIFREDKQALVLATDGVRAGSAAQMAQDFDYQRALRPGLGNAVLHVALSLPAEEALGRSPAEVSELLRQIGQAYIQEMKLENTQWALVQHFDRSHPHAHLVVNRVDNTGATIGDSFIGQDSREVCQKLERQFKLIEAEQRGRDQALEAGPTHRQQMAQNEQQQRAADWQRARHETYNALGAVASFVGGWAELTKQLKPDGVAVHHGQYIDKNGQQRVGVVFEKDGFRFKGGDVGPEFRAEQLEQKFATFRSQEEDLKKHIAQAGQIYALGGYAELYRQQGEADQKAQEKQVQEKQATPAAASQVAGPQLPFPGRKSSSSDIEMD